MYEIDERFLMYVVLVCMYVGFIWIKIRLEIKAQFPFFCVFQTFALNINSSADLGYIIRYI